MGFSIALTGLIMSVFGLLVGAFAIMPPKQMGLAAVCGAIMIVGVWTIPIGLIIQIWQ